MASNIQLLNCNNVVVNSDVTDFTGIGLSDMTIDSTYSGRTLIGKSSGDFETITANRTLTVGDHNKTFFVDATLGNITLTWDISGMEYCKVGIIRTDASANQVKIDSSVVYGTENYVGNGLPYNLALAQYGTKKFTSKGDTIYNLI